MAAKNRKVLLRPMAQRDLDAVFKASPRSGNEILRKLELLAEYPELGPAMARAFQGFRQILCGNYRIIYEIMSETKIEVAYIRHCSRQLGMRLIV